MNILSGRLEIISSNMVDSDLGIFDISAIFSDDTGIFTSMDVTIEDVIFQNLTSFNNGIGKFNIIEIYNTTSYTQLDCKVKWILDQPYSEIYIGVESCICRVINGVSALPSYSVQSLTESFLTYVRNLEMIVKNNPIEVYDAVYYGKTDGYTNQYSVDLPFIPNTTKVFLNGLLLKRNVDYVEDDQFKVILNESPNENDILIINYSRN